VDPKTGLFFAYDRVKRLTVFDSRGNLIRQLNVAFKKKGGLFATVSRLEPHPDGGKLLASITGDKEFTKLISIALPPDLKAPTVQLAQGAVRNVSFEGDSERVADRFARDDPVAGNRSFKDYMISLAAGYMYSFGQIGTTSRIALSLYDPKGNKIAEDDGAALRGSRILIDSVSAGVYRLRASQTDRKIADFDVEFKRMKLPERVAVNKPFPVKERVEGGLNVRELDVELAHPFFDAVSWSNDAKALFVLGKDGWLRRIGLDDFVEDARVRVPVSNSRIIAAKAGMVLQRTTEMEAWIIDSSTLAVRRRLPLHSTTILATSPLRERASSAVSKRVPGLYRNDITLIDYDLTGRLPPVLSNIGRDYRCLAMSPDGRFLFGGTPEKKLIRWRMENRKPVADEIGEHFDPSRSAITLSEDGRWLFRDINQTSPNAVKLPIAPPSGRGFLVYAIGNLKQPAFTIDTKSSAAKAIASNPKLGHIYSHTKTDGFMIFDERGKLLRSSPFDQGKEGIAHVRHISVHPDGRKMLVFLSTIRAMRTLYVELPKDLRP
jgi:hypothetical protein